MSIYIGGNNITGGFTTKEKKQFNESINSLNEQLEHKAKKEEVQNVQNQVNNLVLGAVGDGNNAEVIQARGNYDLLNDRLNSNDAILDIVGSVVSNNVIDGKDIIGKPFNTVFNSTTKKIIFHESVKLENNVDYILYIELEDGTIPKSATVGNIGGNINIDNPFQRPNLSTYNSISITSYEGFTSPISVFYFGKNITKDNYRISYKSNELERIENKTNTINIEQCSFADVITNKFKSVKMIKGKAIDPKNGLAVGVSGITRTVTDFIEIDSKYGALYVNTNGYIAYYDKDKTFLKSYTSTFETPKGRVLLQSEDIKYIRYTFVTEDDALLNTYSLTDHGTPYVSDEYFIPKKIVKGIDSWYENKKVCVLGDSLVAQNKWQPYVESYFNLTTINRGIGGTTVANDGTSNYMSSDSRVNSIPTDSDVILILGGHNDWSNPNILMGDLKTDELSDETFKLAYALMIKKIQTRCPNAKIMTLTPIGGRTWQETENMDKQPYIRDLCMTDIANAVKEVSAYYAIPCIDLNSNSRLNTLNHTTYISDLVHVNNLGGKLIANEVINGMKRYEPIEFI